MLGTCWGGGCAGVWQLEQTLSKLYDPRAVHIISEL